MLGYMETVSFRPDPTTPSLKGTAGIKASNFAPERASHFRYALFVANIKSGENGIADTPGPDLMISRNTLWAQFGPIVFMHELGHTLNLCHPQYPDAQPPHPCPTCPTPIDWDSNPTVPGQQTDCNHYCGVSSSDTTAMGGHWDRWRAAGIAIAAVALGIVFGLIVAPVVGVLGAILIGSVVALGIGALGGMYLDIYQRFVDYHPNEWAALSFAIFGA